VEFWRSSNDRARSLDQKDWGQNHGGRIWPRLGIVLPRVLSSLEVFSSSGEAWQILCWHSRQRGGRA